jgi:4'-phosphopantetheinyl transferase
VNRSTSESTLDAGGCNIDIWLTFYSDISDERLLQSLRNALSEKEQHKIERFRFADGRKSYLVSRWLVRQVLSKYVDIAPADWVFIANPYGRPSIVVTDAAMSGLVFNLSHTPGLIVLGVTWNRNLGVDVENVSARRINMAIIRHCFSPTEVSDLSGIHSEHLQERLFEYWTLKKSYVKARGRGLSIPLDRISFSFPRESVLRFAVKPDLGDEANRWCFWQYRPTSRYLLTVCTEHLKHEALKLTFHKLNPPDMDETFDLSLHRTSECAHGR